MATLSLTAVPQTTYGTIIELPPLPSKTPPLPEVIATLGQKLKEHEATWQYKLHHFTEEHMIFTCASIIVIGAAIGIGTLGLATDKLASTYMTDIIGFCIIFGVGGVTISLPVFMLFLLISRSNYINTEDIRILLTKANHELAYENFMRLQADFFQDPHEDKMPAIFQEFSSVPNAQFPLPRTISYGVTKEGHRAVLNYLLLYTLIRPEKTWNSSELGEICTKLNLPTLSDRTIAYFEEHRSKMLPLIPFKKD